MAEDTSTNSKSSGYSIKEIIVELQKELDAADRKLESLRQQTESLTLQFSSFRFSHTDYKSILILSIVKAGLTLETKVLSDFYSKRQTPLEEQAQHLDELSDADRAAISSIELYQIASAALGSDFRKLLNYRNEITPPYRLDQLDLLEVKAKQRAPVCDDELDPDMISLAIVVKNRLKNVPGMDKVIDETYNEELEEIEE